MHCGLLLTYSRADAANAAKQILKILTEARVPFTAQVDPQATRMKLVTNEGKQEIDLATADAETIRAGAHLDCTTPVVPLEEDVTSAVRGGYTFRCLQLAAGPSEDAPTPEPPAKQTRKLSPETIPSGVVVMGTRGCPHTLHAAQILNAKKIPFYFIEISGQMGNVHENFETLLKSNFAYDNTDRDGSLMSTVPIVLVDGKLVGGASQLESALLADDVQETIRQAANRSLSDCVVVAVTSKAEEAQTAIEEATSSGKVFRAMLTLK